MGKWKTRKEGSASQIGSRYQERDSTYPYGAKRRGSGAQLPTQSRSVDSMKTPPRIEWSDWKEHSQIPGLYLRMGRSGTGRNAKVFLQTKTGKDGKPEWRSLPPEEFTIPEMKTQNDPEPHQALKPLFIHEGYYEVKEDAQDAARKHHGYVRRVDSGMYAGDWEVRAPVPGAARLLAHVVPRESVNGEYEEITFGLETMTASQKRKAIIQSEEFKIWFHERLKTKPMPSDPYRAFMIDRSLKAELRDRDSWAHRTNVADWEPVDYPPVIRGQKTVMIPPPKSKEAAATKAAIRAKAKVICTELDVPCPKIKFTTSDYGRPRSYYQSGYVINRYTGAIVRAKEPFVVIGLPKSGKLKPEQYAVLAHELGHHKVTTEIQRTEGDQAVIDHYTRMKISDSARNQNERDAWHYAKPFMKDSPAVQHWIKKYALGSYLGTTPGYKGYKQPD